MEAAAGAAAVVERSQREVEQQQLHLLLWSFLSPRRPQRPRHHVRVLMMHMRHSGACRWALHGYQTSKHQEVICGDEIACGAAALCVVNFSALYHHQQLLVCSVWTVRVMMRGGGGIACSRH